MSDEQNYEVKPNKKAHGPGKAARMVLGASALGLVGLLAYPVLVPNDKTPIETSDSLEFQEGASDNGFARIEPGEPAPQPSFDFTGVDQQLADQKAAMEARNRELQSQVEQLEARLKGIAANAGEGQQALAEQISAAVTAANEENARILREMQEATNEQISELQTRLADAETRSASEELARLEAERQAAERIAQDSAAARLAEEQAAADRARQAELQRIREEQKAQMELRVKSPSVVFDERGSSRGGEKSASISSSLGRNPTSDERNRAFVENGAPPVQVTTAEVIANPSKTVIQGTMITATLEKAVDSSLPGELKAMVNEPVYSFDGSNVLIPSGSTVIGSYSSDVSLAQGRLLVRWTRVITPEGQSVQFAAFGSDEQGRSGLSGRVNTRFGQRFGGAALISLIGAVPSLAADAYATESELAAETAENIGDDFTTATANVVNEYATLPPIITEKLGASVTIMVDRDLEFF